MRTTNRRTLLTASALVAGTMMTRAAGVAAQATPTATPVTQGACDPYAFLAGIPTFTVTSTDVSTGQEMPAAHRSGIANAGGQDRSPQLDWSDAPAGAKSFVVTMFDADAPTPSGFWHWAVIDIPAGTTGLPTGAGVPDSTALPPGSVQLPNDASLPQYLGAAPPAGPSHRYFITVFALDVDHLQVKKTATPASMSFMTLGHIKGYGQIVPIATTSS